VNRLCAPHRLSADHVIVLGCDDVNLEPSSRNAVLVAMTRARKSLTLMASIGGGGATKLHPFVCALPDDHTRALYVKAGGTKESETVAALQTQLEKWAYAKRWRRINDRGAIRNPGIASSEQPVGQVRVMSRHCCPTKKGSKAIATLTGMPNSQLPRQAPTTGKTLRPARVDRCLSAALLQLRS
jgi:hypothetical protein